MKLKNFILFVILLFFGFVNIYSNFPDKMFFPDSINCLSDSEFLNYLSTSIRNEGQKKFITRVLNNDSLRKEINVIRRPVTEKSISELAKCNNPFMIIEVFDIISYNNNYDTLFSTWFFKKVTRFVEYQPDQLIFDYLRIISKSDGEYALLFVDPLFKLITLHHKNFVQCFKKIEKKDKICGILKNNCSQKEINLIIKCLSNYINCDSHSYIINFIYCLCK